MKHTPGPWEVNTDHGYPWHVRDETTTKTICRIGGHDLAGGSGVVEAELAGLLDVEAATRALLVGVRLNERALHLLQRVEVTADLLDGLGLLGVEFDLGAALRRGGGCPAASGLSMAARAQGESRCKQR